MAQNDNHLLFDGKGTAIFCNAKGGGEVLLTYFSGNCLHANFFLSSAIVEDYERERYSYMLGFINNKEGRFYRIGGMPDHVHLFVSLPATLAMSKFVQELKSFTPEG